MLKRKSIQIATYAGLCVTALVWAPSTAIAEELDADEGGEVAPAEGQAGVMVRPFTGARSKTVEDAVVKALEKAGIMLVPAGFEGDVELGNAAAPYVKVAKANNIKAYVSGKVKMAKAGWSLELTVRNGKDGKSMGSEMLTAPGLPGLLQSIKSDLLDTLDAKLSAAKTPGAKSEKTELDDARPQKKKKQPAKEAEEDTAEPEPEEAAAPEEAEEEEANDKPADSAKSESAFHSPPDFPLDVQISFLGGSRSYSYNQPVGDAYEYALQEHSLPFFGLRFAGHWYPGAHLTTGPLANIGLALSYYQSLASETGVPAPVNKKFPTRVVDMNIGLRARVNLEAFRLGINAGWGRQQTVIQDRGDNPLETGILPDADYTFYRFGPDLETSFLGLDWNLGLFYRVVSIGTGAGQIADPLWFPGATATGFDAQLDVGIPLSKNWSIAINGEFRQIGIDMHSPASANDMGNLNQAVAGGATDRYIVGSLGVRWTMDPPSATSAAAKASSPAPEATDPETPPPDPEVPPEE